MTLFNLDVTLCDEILNLNLEHIKECSECRKSILSLGKTAMIQTLMYRFVKREKVTEFMEYLQQLEEQETNARK